MILTSNHLFEFKSAVNFLGRLREEEQTDSQFVVLSVKMF